MFPLSENTGLALTTAKYYTPSGRLIQRDYTGVSLYDYYYNRDNSDADNKNSNREVKTTDSGRTVYGGGGITPDVKVTTPKQNHFQDTLLQHYAFFNFAKHYTINHQVAEELHGRRCRDAGIPQVPRRPEGPVHGAGSRRSERLDPQQHQERNLHRLFRAGRRPESSRGRRSARVKALELMGQAKTLADNANKIVAERNSARASAMASQNR